MNVYLMASVLLLVGCSGTGSGGAQRDLPSVNTGADQTLLAGDNTFIEVYKNAGAVQCGYDGDTPEQSAQFLIDNGVDVESSSCGAQNNIAVIALCGAGTTKINTHWIREANVADAQQLGYEAVSQLEDGYTDTCLPRTVVYDTQLIRGCSDPLNRTLAESIQVLTDSGLAVLQSSCGRITGVAFQEACFSPAGHIYLHEVFSDALQEAEGLGY